jgi:TRAP-type mannitol/chloroaromatic compound transport system permease small subunit
MRKFVVVIDAISAWVGRIASFLMVPCVVIVIWEVSMRYIFQRPTIWASETVLFLTGYLTILGAAWTLGEKRHVKIDLFWEKLSPRGRAVADVFTFFFFALYMVLMIWASAIYTWQSVVIREGSGTPWNPPIYFIKAAFTIALILLFFQGIAKFIRDLFLAVKGKDL